MRAKPSSQARKVAIAALISALGVVILYIGSIITVLDLTTIAAASMLVVLAVIELGGAFPWLVWAVTGILALLLLPNKEVSMFYLLFGGPYPIFKAMFERYHPVVSWILKLSFFNTSLLFIITSVAYIINVPETELDFRLIIFAVGNAVFVLYDAAASKIIAFYLVKLRRMLRLGSYF
jgi:hypothetical protein